MILRGLRSRQGLVVIGAGAGLGWLIAGGLGMAAGAVIGLVTVAWPPGLLAALVASPVLLALATVTEAATTRELVPRFASLRPFAHDLGLVSVLIWLGVTVIAWKEAAPTDSVAVHSFCTRRWWPLAPLVIVAVMAVLLTID